MTSKLNDWQHIAADHYCDGEMSHVASMADVGAQPDTLFKFVMIELSDDEDCDSVAEAARRIRTAILDLGKVYDALNSKAQD